MRLIYKLILTILILYSLYLCWAIIAFGGGCKGMEGEIHYIPKNYIGKISIIFDVKNGAKKEYNNSKRLYRIPRTGQLKSQFKLNHGWTNTDISHDFFYINEDNLIPIIKLISSKDFETIDSNSVYILEYGIGTGWEIGDKKYYSNTYIVDTLKNINKYR